jgi:hypothetical protein
MKIIEMHPNLHGAAGRRDGTVVDFAKNVGRQIGAQQRVPSKQRFLGFP